MEFKGMQGELWDIHILNFSTDDDKKLYFFMVNDGIYSNDEELLSHKQLISKAPEMLEMLKEINDFIQTYKDKNYMIATLNGKVSSLEKLIKEAITI